jgi:hypothetical protein
MNHGFTDPIPSSFFSYNPNTRTFFAEASNLHGYDFLQRVQENPRYLGFVMKSTKSGIVVPFILTNRLQECEEYDGELHGWRFSCGHDDNPNNEHYICLIVND